MSTMAFTLVLEEAKKYGSWQKKQLRVMQMAEDKDERENVQTLKQAKEYFSSLMRGAA